MSFSSSRVGSLAGWSCKEEGSPTRRARATQPSVPWLPERNIGVGLYSPLGMPLSGPSSWAERRHRCPPSQPHGAVHDTESDKQATAAAGTGGVGAAWPHSRPLDRKDRVGMGWKTLQRITRGCTSSTVGARSTICSWRDWTSPDTERSRHGQQLPGSPGTQTERPETAPGDLAPCSPSWKSYTPHPSPEPRSHSGRRGGEGRDQDRFSPEQTMSSVLFLIKKFYNLHSRICLAYFHFY